MAIFGIGAFFEKDVSQAFIKKNLVGIGHSVEGAPELHQFMRTLKVGDIVYIKSFSPRSRHILVMSNHEFTSNPPYRWLGSMKQTDDIALMFANDEATHEKAEYRKLQIKRHKPAHHRQCPEGHERSARRIFPNSDGGSPDHNQNKPDGKM